MVWFVCLLGWFVLFLVGGGLFRVFPAEDE